MIKNITKKTVDIFLSHRHNCSCQLQIDHIPLILSLQYLCIFYDLYFFSQKHIVSKIHFCPFLLRCNSQAIKFILLEVYNSVLLVYHKVVRSVSLSNSRIFHIILISNTAHSLVPHTLGNHYGLWICQFCMFVSLKSYNMGPSVSGFFT